MALRKRTLRRRARRWSTEVDTVELLAYFLVGLGFLFLMGWTAILLGGIQ